MTFRFLLSATMLLSGTTIFAFQFGPSTPPPFDDVREMMKKLGIKALRPGANGNDKFDETNANRYKDSMPDVLQMLNGRKVTFSAQWLARRKELVQLFETEVYGKVPKNAPKVNWEVTGVTPSVVGGIPVVTKTLVGHVDNSSYPAVKVDIQASFTVPVHITKPVPMMVEFGFGFFGGFGAPQGKPWTQQAIEHGWGYGFINPNSIQPDNNHVELGVIGLCNKGKPRDPEDWGALRAWAWGFSRLIDYFEQHKDSGVDSKKVGIEGVSRYGKAALVAQAFDERVAVGFIASSGEGGSKLHRHIFGEAVENLAGGMSYWMAGNFMKYAASEPFRTAADLPVDSHELIALCAPRPCFISSGIPEKGDAHWIDAHGSFMAGVLAGPVYRLLGKKDLGTPGNYLTDPMPPVNSLIGGELAWRQHDGGHESTPNWPTFFEWIAQYIPAPTLSIEKTPMKGRADQPSARQDQNSMIAHYQMLQKAAKGRIDLYFLGDSITRRWGTSDEQYAPMLENWKANFHGWNAGNFGWGADCTQHILWRVKNGELDGVNPKVIVVLAGTNNTFHGHTGAQIAEGVKAIVETCREKAPDATIIVTAIFPRLDSLDNKKTIEEANKRLEKLADGHRILFLNVNPQLLTSDGKLKDGLFEDGIHPTVAGYQVWADGLKPLLLDLLGKPSNTDCAPPPTGDPSLQKR